MLTVATDHTPVEELMQIKDNMEREMADAVSHIKDREPSA